MSSLNRRSPITPAYGQLAGGPYVQNLVLLLSFYEAGGSVIHSADGHNPAIFHTPSWRSSRNGPAAILDGSASWIEVPANPSFNDAGIGTSDTFSVVVNLLWNSSSETYGLVYSEEDSGAFNLALFIKSDGTLAIYEQSGSTDPVPAFTLSVGYHQIAWTQGGSGLPRRVYVDGIKILDDSVGSFTPGTSARRARIGGGSIFGSGRFINGYVGMVAKWARQLTDAEVQGLWQEPASIYQPYRRVSGFTPVGPPVQTIAGANGIPSAEAFGSPGSVLNAGDQTVVGAAGIPSAEAFGIGGAVVLTPGIIGTVGIPSAEAFGTGGSLSPGAGLVGQYGIPSAERFGYGGALLARDFQVFLGGQDITNLLLAVPISSGAPQGQTTGGVLTITDPMTGPTTATCTLRDPAGLLHPAVGQEFLFYFHGVRIFGGSVEEASDVAFQAIKSIVCNLKLTDFSELFDRRAVGKYYSLALGNSLSIIVSDIIQNNFAGDGLVYDSSDGDPGTALGPLTFNWILARAVFDQLAAMTGWDYKVDPFKVLRFFPHTTGLGASSFAIQDNDGNWLAESLSSRTYRGKYINRAFVLSNTQAIGLWCDIFSAAIPGPFRQSPQPPDGTRIDFVTLYTMTATPTVTLNGNPQVVKGLSQIAGHVADGTIPYDWYWVDPNGAGVFQNQTHAPITSADTLEVCYPSQVPPVIFAQDLTQIAARAAVEGNSGIYDGVFQAKDITDPASLQAYAQGLITRFGSAGIPREVQFSTNRDGLRAGQLIRINTSNPFVPDAEYLITTVTITDVDKTYLRYQVTATSGANPADWLAFFNAVNKAAALSAPSNREQHTWVIAPSYAGITNPGVQGGVQAQLYVIQAASALLISITVSMATAAQTEGWGVQILINGNGAFTAAGANPPVFPPGAVFPATFFFPNPTRVFAGDVIQVDLQRSIITSPGKDMSVTLTASVSL